MRIFSAFTFIAYCHLLNAFTVQVTKDMYVVEHGSNVTMECIFPVEKQLNMLSLFVSWEKGEKKIIELVNGKEDLTVQHSSYRQRAWLLKDQLFLGKATLQITDVKLQDAGTYCCLISYGGADYKRIILTVYAPYHIINQRISVDPVTSEHELTCQAEGYPKAEVIWTNSDHQVLSGKTVITNSEREENLLNVTSILRVNTTVNEIFYCTFQRTDQKENSTAELVIPEPPKTLKNERLRLPILGSVLLFLVAMSIIICLKKNGCPTILIFPGHETQSLNEDSPGQNSRKCLVEERITDNLEERTTDNHDNNKELNQTIMVTNALEKRIRNAGDVALLQFFTGQSHEKSKESIQVEEMHTGKGSAVGKMALEEK
ncbi:PREDICTED: programmed cell death 1 ligand 1 [Condylura cristata]|uniref:programmed cell death 1 ligand 1 n=1 Tax=Condylura cristata TaxID=143302 RepID=UPI000642A2C1|nr:PREDICTED: programmed cell death 1 ligand 1 [Condylura cristata]